MQWDCHLHVFGPAEVYPYTSRRSYTPEDAPLDAYLEAVESLGFNRFVLVQPSVYGLDNTRHLKALARLGGCGRLVAVIDGDTGVDQIRRLHAAGTRGARFNLLFEGGADFQNLEDVAFRIRPFGWHIQLLVDGTALSDYEDHLRRLAVPLVFDHLGHVPAAEGTNHPGFRALLRLVREGQAWVKLSGPYRISDMGYPFEDVAPFVEALLEADPGRLVWGSDWPHPQPKQPVPSLERLVALLEEWIPDKRVRRDILGVNPTRLYDFPSEMVDTE